jgi:hypothetical protein
MKRGSWLWLAVLAAGLALSVASPAEAQSQDTSGCRMAADGTLECGTIEIHGTLRNIVMVSFNREPLGIRLLELRQSFLGEIERSVEGDPF